MKAIIWVYGTSRSDKHTFIKSLLIGNDLNKIFRLDDKSLVASENSFANLGKLDDSRTSMIEEVASLIQSNDAVVIKWQYGDTI